MNVFVPSVQGLVLRAVLAEVWKVMRWWPAIAFFVVGSLSDCGRMMGTE